jgi:hypothetical protein
LENPQKLKTATRNSKKLLVPRIFHKTTIGKHILVLLKTKTLSCDIFVKMGHPKILLVLQILHKKQSMVRFFCLCKSTPILLEFCEKLTPQLEFWRSSFPTKDNRKSVQVFARHFSWI